MKDPELWQKLVAHEFRLTDGTELAAALAKAAGFSRRKAARVVEEYRKFLYIAAISDETVAPPPVVDAAWHTHILDTRAYHDGLCGKVIGKLIHHTPGRPTTEKDPAYARSHDLVRAEFDGEPFPRVWASPAKLKLERWVRIGFGAGIAMIVVGAFLKTGGLMLAGLALVIAGALATGFWSSWRAPPKGSGGSSGDGCGGDGCGGD